MSKRVYGFRPLIIALGHKLLLLNWKKNALSFRLLDLVASLGKKYIVWQEIFDNNVQVSVA